MRLTYLCIPLFAAVLVGCGEEEEATFPETNTAPQTEEYGTPTDPTGDPMDPNNSTGQPPADTGTRLGTEHGPDPGGITGRATRQASRTTPHRAGNAWGRSADISALYRPHACQTAWTITSGDPPCVL